MKFGRNYHKHQLAEWADAYMNYAALKRLCKEPTGIANVQEVAARCMDALNVVNRFYRHHYYTLHRKVRFTFVWQYSDHDSRKIYFSCDGLAYVELEHTKAAFKKLMTDFDKLRWYGRVNADAFRKIICKIRSLVPDGHDIALEVEGSLCRLDFATQDLCLRSMGNLHEIITYISRTQEETTREPAKAHIRFFTRLAKVHPFIPALRFWSAVENNDPVQLERLIDITCRGDLAFSRTELLRVLFHCSIPCSQYLWVNVVLSRAIAHDAVEIVEDALRNVIADLCWSNREFQQARPFGSTATPSLLTCMLKSLLLNRINLLYKQDHLGRIPLHYACEGDSPEICGMILKSMRAWEKFDAGETKGAILLKDMQSRSPIKISILGGHLEVTDKLVRFEASDTRGDVAALRSSLGELLLFAIRSNLVEAATRLLDFNADVDCSDALGQTALYLAARCGNEILTRLLLRYRPDIDRPEINKNWSSLIVASLAGFTTIAELLLENGANVEHRDHAGWTAIDHASYRGHISLAKTLAKAAANTSHKQAAQLLCQPKSPSEWNLPAWSQSWRTISANKTCVVVDLASLILPHPTLTACPGAGLIEDPDIIPSVSWFSLRASMVGTTNPAYTTLLPLLEDPTNKPFTFTIVDPVNANLLFEVVRNESTATEGQEVVGRGMALLGDNYQRSHATKRESLSRDITVPILPAVGSENIGAVTFTFIISTPLVLPETLPIDTEVLWSENGPPKVVGHRGLGENVLPATRLQIGENTIQSYLSAMLLGASYVELDVQLTKDHIPVVYHDFIVSETGTDSPMHTITCEQFMQINSAQSNQHMCAVVSEKETECLEKPPSRKMRTLSVNDSKGIESQAFKARSKHTFDYKTRGYKGNTRGDFIHDAYVTFEQLLRTLPPNIALDIEIKYPMLSEAVVDWKMDPFFVEANHFVDTILLCLAEHISTRAVVLSSFSPEMCILLACKQTPWPIFFLTEAGTSTQTDVRATSLQEAVRFAKKWGLDGVVSESEPFVLAPQLVEFVKGNGLVCGTYGTRNDDVEGATIQAKAGVDIIVTNNVRLISETLAAVGHKEEIEPDNSDKIIGDSSFQSDFSTSNSIPTSQNLNPSAQNHEGRDPASASTKEQRQNSDERDTENLSRDYEVEGDIAISFLAQLVELPEYGSGNT